MRILHTFLQLVHPCKYVYQLMNIYYMIEIIALIPMIRFESIMQIIKHYYIFALLNFWAYYAARKIFYAY